MPSFPATVPPVRRALAALVQWFDSDHAPGGADQVRADPNRVEWIRCIPFIILHAGCFIVLWAGVSPFAVGTAVALYFLRMFAVTGIYHRYFSHRTYRTSRFGQFLLALWGATTVQRGALWWAYHHRNHHQHSDEPADAHSPHVHGFWWSHIGWITSRRNFPTDYSKLRDFTPYPELVWLNRFDTVVPILFATGLWGLGWLLELHAPGLHTTRWQMLGWGFFVSTTVLFHGTSCINSLAHLMGRRRFQTSDHSRNSWILTFITLGEGWHNNHHRYMSCTRQGFYWWEFDPTYYGLKLLSWTGFIWDLKPVPASVLAEAASSDHASTIAAAERAALTHPEFSSFKKVVPAAAAMAMATLHASHGVAPRRFDPPAIQRDLTGLAQLPDATPATPSAPAAQD
ncbi:MAG: stearoyl-CoA desaturase (delta-9 desaturase) [Verrucomicrobia bacterium]|nr:MAG: stearoyl-CoA desaturase (delta-9 desaturase) [Verrucomicrobiota bacterium]